jgi:alkylated DNA nucleotide flippase Atl1
MASYRSRSLASADVTPFVRAVLDAVDLIPRGRVMSYSDVAEFIAAGSGRAVGTVMASHGGEVPWHRVVRSDGSCAPRVRDRQVALLRAEGVPMDGLRVDLTRARWDGSPVVAGCPGSALTPSTAATDSSHVAPSYPRDCIA